MESEKKQELVIDGNSFYEIDLKCLEEKKQKQEEKASENPSALHRGEDVRQCHKDQLRAAVRLYVIGKARRENNKTCGDGYKRIEHRNIDRLSEQRFSSV